VVETGGLENRLALTGYGGSNPSPSARNSIQFLHHQQNSIPWRSLGSAYVAQLTKTNANEAFCAPLRLPPPFSEAGPSLSRLGRRAVDH
jgi:hypothetical protein